MRNPILQLPQTGTARDRRRILRAAIRQLDRAEVYIAAVAYMELDDRQAQRALKQLRADVESLKGHLGESRDRLTG